MSRAEYEAWESRVLAESWDDAYRRTRRKAIVFAYHPSLLPIADSMEKRDVQLYHLGKQKESAVAIGWNASRDDFVLPATDTGGLTNLRLKLGERLPRGTRTFASSASASDVYREWKRVSGKRSFTPASVYTGFCKWMHSVRRELPAYRVGVYKLKDERLHLVPASVVKRRVGRYLIRVFGKGDDRFARDATPDEVRKFWCAVVPSGALGYNYANGNIHVANVVNEYVAVR